MTRRYCFEHMMNMRDLGGYPAENGGVTKFGRILRSDVPARLLGQELERVKAIGVTTIIDLRHGVEIERTPCAFAGADGFIYHRCPLIGSTFVPDAEEDVGKFYVDMAGNTEAMAGVMRIIAAAPGGVLFHCTAGKDRTGVVAALLLMLAGVRDVDIIADYQVTETYIREMTEKAKQNGQMLAAWMGRSRPMYIESFLNGFRERFTSIADYMKLLGINDNGVSAIKNKLTGE